MNIKTNLADKSNYGGQRNTSAIKYIVIHYTGNDGDSDEANGKYFNTGGRNASAHYFVDDDSITCSVPEDYVAWSVGGSKYSNSDKTGGGTFYGKCTNNNSISIELCDSVRNGKYDFTENTLKQAAELTRSLMEKYHIDIEHVIRHFDVTGKHCPGPFVESSAQWQSFKSRLVPQVTETPVDKELFAACQILVNNGIINKESFNLWKRVDLIQYHLVPSLLGKMGGVASLIQKGIITQSDIWLKGTYNTNHVRSLIIKYAKYLETQA